MRCPFCNEDIEAEQEIRLITIDEMMAEQPAHIECIEKEQLR